MLTGVCTSCGTCPLPIESCLVGVAIGRESSERRDGVSTHGLELSKDCCWLRGLEKLKAGRDRRVPPVEYSDDIEGERGWPGAAKGGAKGEIGEWEPETLELVEKCRVGRESNELPKDNPSMSSMLSPGLERKAGDARGDRAAGERERPKLPDG